MNLLIIRHSAAEKREDWNELGNPDILRPLTKKGLSRFAETISGLSRFISNIDHIYSSQYVRAIQTAEMLHGHFKESQLTTIPELNPEGDFKGIHSHLKKFNDESTIAIVGHQPDLSELTSYLLGSEHQLLLRYKKGGVALISFLENSAQLQWLMTQRQLCYLSLI